MKRITAFILMLAMVISLTVCGKSEEVKNTEQLIRDIGEVELSDLAAIEAAESSFAALSAEDQSQVSNYKTLTDARQQWEFLRTDGARDDAKHLVEVYCGLLYDVSNARATIETVRETSDDEWQIKGYVSVNYGGKAYSGAFECSVSYDRDSCTYDTDIENLDKLTR